MSLPERLRVEVEWVDSQIIAGGWQEIGGILKTRKSVRCHSVGFILADDKDGIVLASSVNGENAYGTVVIPRGQIVKRRRLRGANGMKGRNDMGESRARRRIRKAVELFGFRLVSLEWEPITAGAEKSGPCGGWLGYIERQDGGMIDAHWTGSPGRVGVAGYNVEHVLDWIDEFVRPVDPCVCPRADPVARQRAQLQNHTADCRYYLTYRLPWFAARNGAPD